MRPLRIGAILMAVAGVAFVFGSRDGMFALFYGPVILLSASEPCPPGPVKQLPPPIKTEGVLIDSSFLLHELGSEGGYWDIENVAQVLIKSRLKYLEMKSNERQGKWLVLSDGNPQKIVKASWASRGDARCSQYAAAASRSDFDPWHRFPANMCVAIEFEDNPTSPYAILEFKPVESDATTWTWNIVETQTNKVYATQSEVDGPDVRSECDRSYEDDNRIRFAELVRQTS